ncbi:MAG: ribonuclease Z [Candidatus Thermoplasmatota archaeon]|nr:ribonuclease Z [Candidatus Thermoplasmatota archaeon]
MASNVKLTFLGTGGSWPAIGRSLPAIALQIDDIFNLLDCGEGTQKQIMKSQLSFMKIDNVFITHFHGDHFLGLLGLIQSMSFNSRERPLNIYGPRGAFRMITNALNVGYFTLGYEIVIHELAPEETYDFGKFKVRTHQNDHPVPCIAYSFEEPDFPKIDLDKALKIGFPRNRLEELREKGLLVINGRSFSIDDVSSGMRRGRKIVYSGDTRPKEDMKEFAKDADVFIHDTTTDSSLEPKVNEFGHTSAKQAAEIAKAAKVGRFYLFHYSPRVDNLERLLSEARGVFSQSFLSRELLEYEVPVRR